MKKNIFTICLALFAVYGICAQTAGVTHTGKVTRAKDNGTVDLNGQIVPCPTITRNGQIIDYNSVIQSFEAYLDGMTDIAMSIVVSSVGNADSVGFECATDTNFTSIVRRSAFAPVGLHQYKDTAKALAQNTKYFLRAYVANCQGVSFSDTISLTTDGNLILTFFAHDGTGAVTSQEFQYGETKQLNPNTFTRDNATFVGWSTDPSGCNGLIADGTSFTLVSDSALYAQWKHYCTVTSRYTDNESGTATRVDSVKDHQDHWYKVVQIGNQCWLAENMRCNTSPKGNLASGGSTLNYFRAFYYDYSATTPLSLRERGYLYNWAGAMDTNAIKLITASFTDRRGICPQGWHVPSDEEWMIMERTVAPTASDINTIDYDLYQGASTDLAANLSGGCDWNENGGTDGTPNGYLNPNRNASGFTALPAGGHENSYYYAGSYTYFWTSTSSSASGYNAFYRVLCYNLAGVKRKNYAKRCGYVVRCVRDAE